ncbi:MAG: hemerythrin domain-containing protein [Sulfuricella sp.]|nr:hemerythrin domain-containing protein [Sulfuricella sp.]
MQTISDFMSTDHHRCDDLFAVAEEAADGGDWGDAEKKTEVFLDSMRHHFAMEEEVLFPAFEARTGMTMGPTQVMRMEHQQMRSLFEAMAHAMEKHDKDDFLGQCETLLVLMQQHNLKEEQILYHMADQALSSEAGEVIGKLQEVQ